MIPTWAYGIVWRQYQRYCKAMKLDPFSDDAFGIWRSDISEFTAGELFIPPEVDVIDDIMSAARMTS